MQISNELREGLDIAFNESTLNYVDISAEYVEVLLDCLCMNENNEFPEDSRVRVFFKSVGRIAVSYRKGEWNDEEAEVLKLDEKELKNAFEGLILDSMYGWEFINLDDTGFNKWSTRLSLDKITATNWNTMNTIDLFAEQVGKDEVTIDLRIWFENLEIVDFNDRPMTVQEFVDSGKRGWDQLYKTGINTRNHQNAIMTNHSSGENKRDYENQQSN